MTATRREPEKVFGRRKCVKCDKKCQEATEIAVLRATYLPDTPERVYGKLSLYQWDGMIANSKSNAHHE